MEIQPPINEDLAWALLLYIDNNNNNNNNNSNNSHNSNNSNDNNNDNNNNSNKNNIDMYVYIYISWNTHYDIHGIQYLTTNKWCIKDHDCWFQLQPRTSKLT